MRTIVACLLLACPSVSLVAAEPQATSAPSDTQARGQTPTPPPLDTTFVYQGQISDGDGPVNYDINVIARLFDAATDGTELGQNVLFDVPVTNGQFTLDLDYGLLFNDENRWLELSVKESGTPFPFTTLSPRQQIRATPFALFALDTAPPPPGDPTGDVSVVIASAPETNEGSGAFQRIAAVGLRLEDTSRVSLIATLTAGEATFTGPGGSFVSRGGYEYRFTQDGTPLMTAAYSDDNAPPTNTVGSSVELGPGTYVFEIEARYTGTGPSSYTSGGEFTSHLFQATAVVLGED